MITKLLITICSKVQTNLLWFCTCIGILGGTAGVLIDLDYIHIKGCSFHSIIMLLSGSVVALLCGLVALRLLKKILWQLL